MQCRQRKNNGKLPAVNITQVVSHHVVHQELKMSVIHSLCTQTARQHSLINSGSQNQNPSIANTEQHCNSHSWFWYIIIIIIKTQENSDNRLGLRMLNYVKEHFKSRSCHVESLIVGTQQQTMVEYKREKEPFRVLNRIRTFVQRMKTPIFAFRRRLIGFCRVTFGVPYSVVHLREFCKLHVRHCSTGFHEQNY